MSDKFKPNLMIPENQKNEKWIKGMIAYYNRMGGNSQERLQDMQCWRYYNNEVSSKRFDYFLKVGTEHLPAYPRHVPLQRTLIDILVSKQLYRPFPFSVFLADKNSVNEKWITIIKSYLFDMANFMEQKRYQVEATMGQIDHQTQQLQQFLQAQPENEEQAMQQQQLQQSLPSIMGKLDMARRAIEKEGMLTAKQKQELDYYYRYTYKDYKEHLAQKILLKLRNELNIKRVSKEVFLSKRVTGKGYYFVDIIDGEKYPRFESVIPSKITFPKISGIRKVQDGPWVKMSENLSFQQVVTEFGEEIEKRYGKEALDNLETMSIDSANTAYFKSTPNGDLDVTNKYGPNVYSGTNDGSGILVERVYFKCPRVISIKYSPNKHNPGEFFRHFIDKHKIPINGDNYNYSNGYYVDKNNDKITFNKAEVERYNEKEGEFIKKKYLDDVYEGIVINGSLFVSCRKKKVIRHPDKKSKVKLPIFGPTYSDVGEMPYSIIWMTKDLQDLYDFVHTQRELMLALSGTKTIFYDRGQKPGDLGDDEFYAQMKKGIAFVETIDKATGQPKRTNFNQWSMVDMSVSASIQYLDSMLANIEDTMGNIVGIPRPAKGQVVNTDQVGTFQESINRAQLVTEVLYFDHDQDEAEALTHMVNLALKYSYRDGDDFELSDAEFGRELVSIPPALFDDSYFEINVFNSSEEAKKMQEIKDILSLGIQKGQFGADVLLNAWGTDTVVALKKKVEYFIEKANELASRNAQNAHQSEIELEKAKIQFAKEYDNQWKQLEAQIKQQKLQLDAEKQKVDAVLKERDQMLAEKKINIDAELKAIELQNEQISEMGVLQQNDKHQSTQERLQAIQMQLDYILSTIELGEQVKTEGLKHAEGMAKIKVEDKKARKMVKEHVSDK